MNKRFFKHKLLILISVVCFFVAWPVIAASSKQIENIKTSPLKVEWNDDRGEFNFSFAITNNNKKSVTLSAILTLEGDRRNRWRGVKLPEISAGKTVEFTFALPASFILRKPFNNMILKVYDQNYTTLSDKSSKYQKLSMDFIQGQQSKVVLKDQRRGIAKRKGKKVVIQNFNLGSKKEVTSILSAPANEPIQGVNVYIDGNLIQVYHDTIFTTLPEPLVMVSGGNEKNLIEISKVAGAQYYNIYWDTKPDVSPETGKKIAGVLGQHLHRGLKNGIQYYYVVTAVNRQGKEGDLSEEESIVPNPRPPKAPELTLKAKDSRIALTWKEVKDVKGYNLRWSSDQTKSVKQWKAIRKVKPGYEHKGLRNNRSYFYRLYSFNEYGEGRSSDVAVGVPSIPKVVQIPIAELLSALNLQNFESVQPEKAMTIQIADKQEDATRGLIQAKKIKALNIASREKMIALAVQEGESQSLANTLTAQLSAEPENVNLSLTLSKVYAEQGNDAAALDVLNASLNRISFSARLALNDELKNKVKAGASTLSTQSEEAFLADEFNRIGGNLIAKKQYEGSLSAYQSLQNLAPDYSSVNHNLGLSRKGLLQYNQAKEHFFLQLEVASTDPYQFNVLHDVAEILPSSPDLKGIKKAIVTYEKAEATATKAQKIEAKLSEVVKADIIALKALLADTKEKIRLGLPDLMIDFQAPFQFDQLQPENEFYLSFQIQNKGKKPSSEFTVSYQLQHEQGASYDIQGIDRFEGLDPKGKPFILEKKLVIPKSVLPGKYRLIAHVQQLEGKIELTLENNKIMSAPTINVIEPQADLKIEFASGTQELKVIYPAQPLHFELKIQNIGGLVSQPIEVSYSLLNAKGELIQIAEKDKIPSIKKHGEFSDSKRYIDIPETLPVGIYQLQAHLILHATAKDVRAENNLAVTGKIYKLQMPGLDLAVKLPSQSGSFGVKSGTPFMQQMQVKNLGIKPSEKSEVNFFLRNEEGEETQIGTYSIGEVKAKDMLDWEQSFTTPENQPFGNYKLVAKVTNQSKEEDQNASNDEIESTYDVIVGDKDYIVALDQPIEDEIATEPDFYEDTQWAPLGSMLVFIAAMSSENEHINQLEKARQDAVFFNLWQNAADFEQQIKGSRVNSAVFGTLAAASFAWNGHNQLTETNAGWRFLKHTTIVTAYASMQTMASATRQQVDFLSANNFASGFAYSNDIIQRQEEADQIQGIALLILGYEIYEIYSDLTGSEDVAVKSKYAPKINLLPDYKTMNMKLSMEVNW